MSPYKNILAVINNQSDCYNTILKAINLSVKSEARLTFLSINKTFNLLSYLTSFNQQQQQHAKRLKDEIDKISLVLQRESNNINFKQIDQGQEHKAILQELGNQDYDLVLKQKPQKHHNYLGLAMSCDWHLLRESSVPIMFVTDNRWEIHGKILTAIENQYNDPAHQHVNLKLLRTTCQLSQLLRSDIHLLSCYTQQSSANNQHTASWQDLVELSDQAPEFDKELHLIEGAPEDQISLLAQKHQMNMVLLGTNEHDNMTNRVAGHTSEHIIDSLTCDVLAIKP
jgi:universal stress protein E